jgi:hypothetical protein
VSLAEYRITIHTADVRSAGTDANVGIILHGQDHNTAQLELSPLQLVSDPRAKPSTHKPDLFARGSVDTFCVKSPVAIGPLIAATLSHDGHGAAAAWLPERMSIQTLKGKGGSVDLLCGEWLGAHWGDQKTSRLFRVPDSQDKACTTNLLSWNALHQNQQTELDSMFLVKRELISSKQGPVTGTGESASLSVCQRPPCTPALLTQITSLRRSTHRPQSSVKVCFCCPPSEVAP